MKHKSAFLLSSKSILSNSLVTWNTNFICFFNFMLVCKYFLYLLLIYKNSPLGLFITYFQTRIVSSLSWHSMVVCVVFNLIIETTKTCAKSTKTRFKNYQEISFSALLYYNDQCYAGCDLIPLLIRRVNILFLSNFQDNMNCCD